MKFLIFLVLQNIFQLHLSAENGDFHYFSSSPSLKSKVQTTTKYIKITKKIIENRNFENLLIVVYYCS